MSLPGAPGNDRYNEWRELIREIHESFEIMANAFLPTWPGIIDVEEHDDYHDGIQKGYRVLHDRILIGDVLKNAGVLEHFESIVKDAVSARTQRDPSQHSCPSQVEYDRKVNEFEAELMALARKDNDLESTQAQTEPAHAAVGRNDKAQEPGKEETEEPAKADKGARSQKR